MKEGREVGGRVLNDVEALGDGGGGVVHSEGGVAAVGSVLGGMPERLVSRPPLHDRGVALPFAGGVLPVDGGQGNDADPVDLDQRYRDSRRVDDDLPVTGTRQRLTLQLVVGEQPGRRGLGPGQDGRHQLIPQRPGKGELRDSQPSRLHAV